MKKDGLDFHPKIYRKPISITISTQNSDNLNFLQQMWNVNVSQFIDSLLTTAFHTLNLKPSDYCYEMGYFRECRVLLRNEVADFLENWCVYGGLGAMVRDNRIIEPSSPIQIGLKISYLLARNSDILVCDSKIYGEREETLEKLFQRMEDKSKQTPDKKPV